MYNLTNNTDDGDLWHAGGISLMGDVLAIPIENSNKSEIHFYDVSVPDNPSHFDQIIIRRPTTKAGAVAVCRVPMGPYQGYYLCGVREKEAGKEGIDFYLSNDTTFNNGFPTTSTRCSTHIKSYQSINFIRSDSGKLFMAGIGPKTLFRRPQADLFRVTLNHATPILTRLETVKLAHPKKKEPYYDLEAAAGTYVDHKGRLLMYAAPRWRVDSEMRFAECTEDLDPQHSISIAGVENGRIDLFKRAEYKSHRLSIYGECNARIADYRKIWIGGRRFREEISSVRFQLPKGSIYRLYSTTEDSQGDDRDYFELCGTGSIESVPTLSNGFFKHRKVLSSKFTR